MPRPRDFSQLSTVLAVALLAGGCGSAAPTVRPATAVPPTTSATPLVPTAIPTAEPSVAPTPQPTVNCSTVGASEGGLDLLTPTGFETIDLQTGALESPAVVDSSDVPIVSTVVGGIELTADLAVGDGLEATTAIAAVSVDFLPFGTTSTLPVTATFSGSTASLRLPDQRVDGQLRVTISWTTTCGAGDGSGTIGLTVVPKKVTAGCPSTADKLETALSALGKAPRITIGTLDEPLTVVGWAGRWLLGNGTTDVPQFAGWDDDRTVPVAPEDPIVVRESIEDLAMVSIQASIYRRADVLAYLDSGSAELETLLFVRRNANTKGRASIPAPIDTGSYVIEVTGSWLTSCLSLETYTVVSVEVQ